ncbi:ATP--cob(I)alamin adenosyltransferase (plasmid) [Fulvitalea axinellae]|uniref:Corrinoid adenosyltransferase n=1 Tax=Fulvitalea axinellae TaxID=1182444 RepID=A0AAU9CHF7_9BACT|nr:ATP--cob(I)alamin adenosyltransferase [Fulvitalea axinellae]
MKVYTKSGDKGTTATIGGPRVAKDDIRMECLGTIDELNSHLGLLRVRMGKEHRWQEGLHRIQVDLMNMMAYVARPSSSTLELNVPAPEDGDKFCEEWIDREEKAMESESQHFLVPGGNEISALLHIARTTVRKAERRLVQLNREDPLPSFVPKYVNRLSDLFFVLSRVALVENGVDEDRWRPFITKVNRK